MIATTIYPVVAYPFLGSFGWAEGTRVPREIVETLKGRVKQVTVKQAVHLSNPITYSTVELSAPIFRVEYDRNGRLLSSKSPWDSISFAPGNPEVENIYGHDGRIIQKRWILFGQMRSIEEMTYTEEGILSGSETRSLDNEVLASTSYDHNGRPKKRTTFYDRGGFYQLEFQRDEFGDVTMLIETSLEDPPKVTTRSYARDQYGNWTRCYEAVVSQDDKSNIAIKRNVYYREISYFE